MRRHVGEGRKKKILGIILGITMFGTLFTFVFFGFSGGTRSLKYNDFEFLNRGNVWTTIVNDREAIFTYFPSDVELILVNDNVINRLKNVVQIDTTSEFNDTFAEPIALAQFQMGSTLNNFNIFVRSGFTSEQQNFPVIKCEDATNFVPVIYFKNSNVTNVYLDNNCIIAEAVIQTDVIRIKDRLVYGILGII